MTDPTSALAIIESYLTESQLVFERTNNIIVVTIPGEKKLTTTCSLSVGDSALTINAFVARHPDDNAEEVYRWLLERNMKMYAVSFAVDHHGDIYLAGKVPLAAVTAAEVDRIIGCVAQYSDSSFNTILELGFATAIKKEYQWRVSRGESTANLAAFAHILEHQD
ncbi:MAG: YbjN domain-containing protein [Candidatus Nanopelagicales bacterium]|nr:YbjN domain-containing protein [Candidatus Nanopelagicales bacterium]MCF8539053.1 YbjN domain-containing protein [Candidatus Nanopelagicales bacterium]MCF8550524.1 YbjN domain-containing protein [Candidatus Nanopelagicales bacterium]